MKPDYRPYYRRPEAYLPFALVAFVLIFRADLPLVVVGLLCLLFLIQAGGLYLAHRDFLRREREMDAYERVNDEAHQLLEKLIDACDGTSFGAACNAALVLLVGAVQADGATVETLQTLIAEIWDEQSVRDVAAAMRAALGRQKS